MARILIVEDELHLCEMIAKWLRDEQYDVTACFNGVDALSLLERQRFSVIVLDLMLPGLGGLDVCKTFRERGGNTPILMLTAKRTIVDKEFGLDSGADDYMTKPFKLRELSARIRALMRRQPNFVPERISFGPLTMVITSKCLYKNGELLKLTPKEFSILEMLMKNTGTLIRTDDIIESVWGIESDVSLETIRSYVRSIREKIDSKTEEKSLITTVHGIGYRLGEPA